MKTVVYLHGAMSSSGAFQYIREKLGTHKQILVEYDYTIKLNEALEDIITTIKNQLSHPEEEICIIGHSLGGVLALNVAASGVFNVVKLVTISAPFGGSDVAWLLSLVHPFCTLFREISPHSKFLVNTRKLVLTSRNVRRLVRERRFLAIATFNSGSVLLKDANDNVVTLKSQTALDTVDYFHIPHNHFEVLISPVVTEKIQTFLTV